MLGKIIYFWIYSLVNIFRVLFWDWKTIGKENLPPRQGGVLFAVNHLSWTDIYVLAGSLPLSYRLTWMAKHEVFGNRFVAWFLRTNDVIPLRRGEADRAAYVAAVQALKSSKAMMMFPEGHRSENHALIQGKEGVVRLAVRAGVPIIPMAVWGTEYGFRGAMSRKPIRIRFGQPYHPSVDLSKMRDGWDKLTEELMLRIASLLPEEYRGLYASALGESSSQHAAVAAI